MAHPSRADFIPYLRRKLGDVPVLFDRKNNVWDTCRRAWLAHDRKCEYAVVIQDDAIICDGFKSKAKKLLTADMVYSFFAGSMLSNRIATAHKKGIAHVDSDMIFNEIALCMPTKYIDEMVKYCDDRNSDTDHNIGNWARAKRIKIRYVIPSLIDHRDDESLFRKIYNKKYMNVQRKAVMFIGNKSKK